MTSNVVDSLATEFSFPPEHVQRVVDCCNDLGAARWLLGLYAKNGIGDGDLSVEATNVLVIAAQHAAAL